jgi:hypothetical protein
MGQLVINNSMTVNGAFEAPAPEPDGGWCWTPTLITLGPVESSGSG